MTNHQQAAIEAARDEIWPKLTFDKVRAGLTATEAIAAAEPHLRKKWGEEIRNGVNPTDTGEMQEWRLGFVTGVLRTARFLEGAGE